MKTKSVVIGVLVSFVALIVLVVGICVTAYVSNYNYANRAENVIKAEYSNMENILAQYTTSIKEAAQITTMQSDDLVRIFTGTLEARYGADGSQAAFQWIQEQNPNLDQSTYLKIQQMMEAGRNKFENAQSRFIDTKRGYETNMGYLWKGFWIQMAGYPKINLDDYAIISSSHAANAFETKIDDGVQLR